MNTKDLSQYIVGLKGKMPESSRTEAAIQLMFVIGRSIGQNDHWNGGGAQRFIDDCQLTTMVRPVVPNDMAVEESKLAAFCNRWLAVSEFRLIDSEDELQPVTAEMHALRNSMVAELKQLAGLEVSELPEEVK